MAISSFMAGLSVPLLEKLTGGGSRFSSISDESRLTFWPLVGCTTSVGGMVKAREHMLIPIHAVGGQH